MQKEYCPVCLAETHDLSGVCPNCGQKYSLHQYDSVFLSPGAILNPRQGYRYYIGTSIGAGGFGITYIAKRLENERVVAVKEYYPRRCMPERKHDGTLVSSAHYSALYQNGIQSFIKEATMLYAFRKSPNIVHMKDYFLANNTAYMVMNFLEGEPLSKRINRVGLFDPIMLAQKLLSIMDVMTMLHAANVLHRDIAPDNILWMPDQTLCLIDFGCARAMEDGKTTKVVLKQGFAPIEQYFSKGQGTYTDVYALCATYYYCVSGKLPPAATLRVDRVRGNMQDPLIPLVDLCAGVSNELWQVIRKGLALQVKDRTPDMLSLKAEMERALSSMPVPDPPRPQPDSPEPRPDFPGPQPDPPVPNPNPDKSFIDKFTEWFHANKESVFPGALLVAIALCILIIYLLM